MLRIVNSPSDLSSLKQILCVYQPTLIHPRWEMFITGKHIGEIDIRKMSRIQQAFLWKSYVQYFRANPREAGYMFNLVRDFANRFNIEAIDLLISSGLADQFSDAFGETFRRVWLVEANPYLKIDSIVDNLREAAYDAIIFLYPDPIGVGWTHTERAFTRLDVKNIIVINGRKRIFVWDNNSRRLLIWRRFLDTIWFVEILLAIFVTVISALLRLYDFLREAYEVYFVDRKR